MPLIIKITATCAICTFLSWMTMHESPRGSVVRDIAQVGVPIFFILTFIGFIIAIWTEG